MVLKERAGQLGARVSMIKKGTRGTGKLSMHTCGVCVDVHERARFLLVSAHSPQCFGALWQDPLNCSATSILMILPHLTAERWGGSQGVDGTGG